ncbi:MAG: DNA polymerase III subunit beta [Cytophagales bacterium]|nr:DNA polymerase III subunit beta [Cytophagales bacterium]MDW8384464.1 DNA polymerase III subunit beta [Flammeovirgaceae bacterium]
MKFLVNTNTLLKHLGSVQGVIPSNPLVPILENFLFDIRNGLLSVTASDLQTTVITQLAVNADGEGSICIPAKMLTDTLKNLPEQPVTFHIDFNTYSLEIVSDNGRYKIACENASDFPKVPELHKAESLEVSTQLISLAINYTLFATSTDEMKPALNGILFKFQKGIANFVSSDSHRLIRYRYEGISQDVEASFIVHRKAMQILRNALPSENVVLVMEFNASNAMFSFGNYKMICRLIDERFPDYENVIPLKNNNLITIDRQELIGCLKRLNIYANKTTNQVRFKISGNEMQVSAEDLDFSNEAIERLFCEHDGPEIEIGFNAKFLLEMLNNLHSTSVTFRLSEPSRAGIVVPSKSEDDVLMLIMPIMLHNYA